MPTLYAGGLAFDGDGNTLEDHGILVDGTRIERVAPVAEFDGFSGDRVDTAGGTVLPGLMDCHVHLCFGGEPDPHTSMDKLDASSVVLKALQRAQENLRGGITAIRDCGGKDYLEFAVRDACNAGTFQGPTIRASGRMICMTGGHGSRMGRVADGVEDVTKAVREQVHAGCDVVKIMATGGVMTPGVNPEDAHYSPEEMNAGVGEAKRFHKSTASHAHGGAGILNAARAGIDSVEHGTLMNDECVEEMVARGTFVVPTCSALHNISGNADKGIPDYAIEKSLRMGEFHRNSIMMFYKAGGRLAMGTDAGTPFNYHGENVGELAFMVEYGINPADALIAATSNAADLIRLDDRGRIKDGHAADLLIVDGNPMQDIANVAERKNHRLVVKDGRAVDSAA